MGFIKRLLVVLGIASIAGAILRVKGKTTDSGQQGGWRQVTLPTEPGATTKTVTATTVTATTVSPTKSAS